MYENKAYDMNLFNLLMIQINIFLMYKFTTIHNFIILSYFSNIRALCPDNKHNFFLNKDKILRRMLCNLYTCMHKSYVENAHLIEINRL